MFTEYMAFPFLVMTSPDQLYNKSPKHIKLLLVCTHMRPLTELLAQRHENKHQTPSSSPHQNRTYKILERIQRGNENRLLSGEIFKAESIFLPGSRY